MKTVENAHNDPTWNSTNTLTKSPGVIREIRLAFYGHIDEFIQTDQPTLHLLDEHKDRDTVANNSEQRFPESLNNRKGKDRTSLRRSLTERSEVPGQTTSQKFRHPGGQMNTKHATTRQPSRSV